MRLLFFLILSLLLPIAACPQEKPPPPIGPHIEQIGPHNTITVQAVGEAGHYIGFDVLADGKLAAPVRFTSRELIFSPDAVAVTKGAVSTLDFTDLQAAPDCGVTLQQSRVIVTLTQQQFPTVAFDLKLASFSPRLWQQEIGMQPFHFLTIGLPEATVWHQRGWLNATPRADLFPLLLDVHANTPELSAFPYNREWSLTPPLSAHALPVVGLWSPARRLYAAWDFQAARLTDNSERDIATGFCNRLIVPVDLRVRQPIEETQPPAAPLVDNDAPRSQNGLPPPRRDPRMRRPLSYDQQASRELDKSGVGKFVALVYPQGGKDYQQLVYPLGRTHIASHAALMFHTDLGDGDDPNRFLWQEWWNTPAIRSRLAHVPPIISLPELSLIVVSKPLGTQLPPTQTLPALSTSSLLTNEADRFQTPGSLLLSGRNGSRESPVETVMRNGNAAQLAQLQQDAQTLLHYVKRFTVDKTPCAYWEQPLAGEYTPEWGGEAATTLHNTQGWAAGRLLLDLYRGGEEEKKRRQGDREIGRQGKGEHSARDSSYENGVKDSKSPLLPISLSPLLPIVDGVFNWTKHIVWTRGMFADSPASASAADGALPIAFLLDYYFTFKDGLLDAEHRTRALQALELARTFAYRYLILWMGRGDSGNRGDSAFLWEAGAGRDRMGMVSGGEIAGCLDALAQAAVHTGDLILMWALQGSLSRPSVPPGLPRSLLPQSSATTNGIAPMENMENTNVRVLCGEKAALALNRNAQTVRNAPMITIRNYRCAGPGEFAFTLHIQGASPFSAAKTPPVSATITFPYVDLSGKAVAVRHGNITQQTLVEGANLTRQSDTCWSIIVHGLREGDTVVVGKPNLSATSLLSTLPPEWILDNTNATKRRLARPNN